MNPLTPRERQVLQLLAGGRTPAMIAEELGTQPKTVRNQVRQIYLKLQVHSRSQATLAALRLRLITADGVAS